MTQILFLFGLYLFGVYFGAIFKREVPILLISGTGFLYGALFWVLGGLFILTTSIPYTPASMAAYYFILVVGFGIIHARNQTWRLSRQEFLGLISSAFLFLLVLVLFNSYNFSYVSSDSISQLTTGRRIAFEGLSAGVIEELSLRGIFLSQLQSASVFLGDDYLHLLQPAFAAAFLLTYLFLGQRIADRFQNDRRRSWITAGVSGLALFSTYFIVFQFFYIHNSLISAVYLFTAVSSFWMAMDEEKESWMVLGTLALLGFSLARNEAPLFGLVFLIPLISSRKISHQTWLRSILPFLTILILWYGYLMIRMGSGTKILDPEKTLAIMASLAAFALLVLFSEWKIIKERLIPQLSRIMLGALLLLLVLMVIQKPDHMLGSVYVSVLNMVQHGRWGVTWLVFSFLFLLSLAGPRLPGEGFISSGIAAFFCLLLAIVYFRNPYRIGWYDSANRMSTHILPLVILYVTMKISAAVPWSAATRSGRSDDHVRQTTLGDGNGS